MNPHYPLVAKRAEHRCEYCRAPEVIFNFPFEVEHIVPTARGGGSEESNLALACRACNLYKAAHLTGCDETSQVETGLFNPRQNRWSEHFRVDLETGEIQGLTEVGRATARRLQMNSPASLPARLQWIRLGLFP